MGKEAFQRILTTKQKTRNDLLGNDTNLTTPIAGKVDRAARRKGFGPSLGRFLLRLTQITVTTPPSPPFDRLRVVSLSNHRRGHLPLAGEELYIVHL
jgi:hypothetical protein